MVSAAASLKYGTGLVGLFKKLWAEKPELIGSGSMAMIGIGFMVYNLHKAYTTDKVATHHKRYTVYRHDDPRVEKLPKF